MKQLDLPESGTQEDLMCERFRMACQSLSDAQCEMQRESYNTAVNRSYYALFKTISALQALDGLAFRSHGQAIGAFNREYIHRRACFPSNYGAQLHDIMQLRHTSDYDDFVIPTEVQTQDAIRFAVEFYFSVKEYCEKRLGHGLEISSEPEHIS